MTRNGNDVAVKITKQLAFISQKTYKYLSQLATIGFKTKPIYCNLTIYCLWVPVPTIK